MSMTDGAAHARATAHTMPASAYRSGSARSYRDRLSNVPRDGFGDLQQFGVRRCFARNETIFEEQSDADQVYRIVEGAVRICRYTPKGRRFIADFLLPADFLGFTNRSQHVFGAEAISDAILTAYPRRQLDALIAASPDTSAQFLSHLSESLLDAQCQLLSLGCQAAKERMACFLMRMTQRMGTMPGERLLLPMKRRDIADHLGISTETACRALSALKAQRIIAIPNIHQIVILDMPALIALSASGSAEA